MKRATSPRRSLPDHGPPYWPLARVLLIAIAACLVVMLAVAVAVGIGSIETLVLIAMLLLLWPMISPRMRRPKPPSGANHTTL